MFLIFMVIQIPSWLVSFRNYHRYCCRYIIRIRKTTEGILTNCGRSTCFNYNFVLWFSEQFPRYSCLVVYNSSVFRVSDLIKRVYIGGYENYCSRAAPRKRRVNREKVLNLFKRLYVYIALCIFMNYNTKKIYLN